MYGFGQGDNTLDGHSTGASKHMTQFLLTGILVLLLTACRSIRTFTPEEVLQKSMQASAALSSVSYTVRATHATGNGDHTNVLLQGNLHRESQKHDWRMSVERDGIFIGSTAGVSGEPYDLYLLPLPATLLEVVQDRGRTQWDNHAVYRYDVALRDAETESLLDTLTGSPSLLPLFHFTGTLWIDSESFLLRRSTWDVTTQASDEIMKLDVTLKNHNTAPTMQIPDGEEGSPQTRASVEHIFENIPSSLSLLLGMPKVTDEMQ